MIPKAASIFFGAAFTAATAWALGRLLLRQIRTPLYRAEFHALAFLCGSAGLSLLVFVLSAARGVYDAAFWALGVIVLAAGWRWGARPSPDPAPRAPWWFWAIYVPFAVVYVIVAMAPEMSPDGSGYHLGVIGTYYRAHGFTRITTHMYANLSMGVEMLFLMAYAFGRHSAAALLHCAFLLVLPLLMLSWGKRHARIGPAAAAALFVLCSPVLGVDGTSAYIDVAVAAGVFTVFYLLELWRESRDGALIPLLGLMAGFGYAMKYTAFLTIPYGAWVLFHGVRKGGAPWRKPLGVFAACAALPVIPWVAKNWIWLGNPVSPLMNRWFPNPYVHVAFEQDYAEYMRNYLGLHSHWDIPLEVTVRGEVLGGLLGPLFLLAPLALLAWRMKGGPRLILTGLLFLAPYGFNIGTRFLIPGLPFVALAMALVFSRWAWLGPGLALLHAVSALPPVIEQYCAPQAWRIARIPLKQALRIESEDSWLGYRSPSYRIARMVERSTEPGAVIYTLTPFAESYTTREVWTSYQSAEGERLRDGLWMAFTSDWQPVLRHEFRFPPRGARRIRVVQDGQGSSDQWSVHEFRVFSGPRELPRAAEWRLRASPNPFDVQLAFDNNPITRWRSWERTRPGMWMQVNLGRTETIDGVVLEQSADQYGVRLRLELDAGDGRWVEAAKEPRTFNQIPWLGLRRMAIEEFKRHGVTHLLASQADHGAADYARESALWGLEPVGQVDETTLYRLK